VQEYDIIHVEDVADAFWAMLNLPTERWRPRYMNLDDIIESLVRFWMAET